MCFLLFHAVEMCHKGRKRSGKGLDAHVVPFSPVKGVFRLWEPLESNSEPWSDLKSRVDEGSQWHLFQHTASLFLSIL